MIRPDLHQERRTTIAILRNDKQTGCWGSFRRVLQRTLLRLYSFLIMLHQRGATENLVRGYHPLLSSRNALHLLCVYIDQSGFYAVIRDILAQCVQKNS